MTDAERKLLDARLADMEAHPDDQSPWPEVKAHLERLDDQDEGIAEALRRDAEIERDPNQAIPLAQGLPNCEPASLSPRSGRSKIAQRFIAGIRITN